MSELDFAVLLERIRTGDEDAAAELVRRYEPIIRRVIRYRLLNPRLSRLLDSEDICQSVLASFFARASGGQFDLNDCRQLLQLLLRMARNKVAFAARWSQAQQR